MTQTTFPSVCILEDFSIETVLSCKFVDSNPLSSSYGQFVLPSMNKQCSHCNALLFPEETEGLCCSKGKVDFTLLPDLPDTLHQLMTTDQEFKKNIQKYNQINSFTSLGAKVDKRLANQQQGVYTFRVHGHLYHLMGSVLPENGENAKFSQIFFYDKDEQVQQRMNVFNDLNASNMRTVADILNDMNPYVHLYQQAREVEGRNFQISFRAEGVDLC